MYKIIAPLIAIICFVIASCGSGDSRHDQHKGHTTEGTKTPADSLYELVMAGHDEVMPRMGKIRGAQKEAQRLVDSINALPENAKAASLAIKSKLEELVKELGYADFAMDKWMTEFNLDSAKDNVELRIQYLNEEKLKVDKVKEAIIKSLAKADSLLKK
jgi:excinuclease UvrABC ATPase subunit